MAVHIDQASASCAKPAVLHMLPCAIEHDGIANVQDYFTISIRGESNDLTSTFRGRELRGQELDVPEGYSGIILQEPNKPFTEEQERHVKIVGTFNNFTYWNLQTPTSVNDKIVQAMAWPLLAQAMHQPTVLDKNGDSSSSEEQQLSR